MQSVPALLACVSALLAGCAVPDHTPDGTPEHAPSSSPGPSTTGYAPLLSSPIRGLSAEEVESIRSGAGMRLALPAELNGYPGPKHILELAQNLSLSAEQHAQVQALYDRVQVEARDAGAELLRRWEALDQGFRAGTWDEAGLRAAVASLDAQQAEVRFIHLRAHLEAKGLLTQHQVAIYNELRGYGGGGHGDHPHP